MEIKANGEQTSRKKRFIMIYFYLLFLTFET